MKIEADVELESLKLQLANIETVKKAAEAANLDPKERAKLEEEASKLVTQIAETEAENRIKASEKVLEREKQLTEMRREVLASSLDAINEITAALVDAAIERIDAEKEASDELYAKQKEGLEDALMIEEMRAREEKRIEEEKQKREEAIAAKKKRAQNIANAIDMAVNIAKTIQATNVAAMEALLIPPPAGEIIATQRRIQGAIALATILATGIPKLEIGLANGIPNLGDGLEIGSRRACRRDPRAVRTHQRSRKLAGRGRRAVGRGHGAARVARDVRGENQRSSQFDDGCKGQSNLEAGEPDQELSRRYQRGE